MWYDLRKLYTKNPINQKKIQKISNLECLLESSLQDATDPESIAALKEMTYIEKKTFIHEVHPFAITGPCGEKHRYQTYVKHEQITKEKPTRKKIVKPSEEQLIEYLFLLYTGMLDVNGNSTYGLTLFDIYPEWLEYKKQRGAAETYIKRINSDWKTYYLKDELCQKPISTLTKLDLEEWLHKIILENRMNAKKYTKVTLIIRGCLNYAVDKEWIPTNPFLKVRIDKRHVFTHDRKKEAKTQVYTSDEAAAVVEEAWKDFRNPGRKRYLLAPLAVIFQFQTGVRVGELCALRFEDISDDMIHIQRMTRGDHLEIVDHTKTELGDRWIYLTPEAKEVIDEAKQFQLDNGYVSNEYIFTTNGQPLLYRVVNETYRRYCSKLGILYRSSHKVRKTAISAMLASNMNVDTVRQLAGHAQITTTYNSYYYDRSLDHEKKDQMSNALSIKHSTQNPSNNLNKKGTLS